MAIAMGDESPRYSEDARISLQRTVSKLGQLAIEAAGKVVANFANLLLYDVKVIHQPFSRGCDSAFFTYRSGGAAIHFEQYSRVVAYPRCHRTSGAWMLSDALGDRKGLAMLFEPLNAEQFRADRLLDVARERCGRAFEDPKESRIQLTQRSVATARAWPK